MPKSKKDEESKVEKSDEIQTAFSILEKKYGKGVILQKNKIIGIEAIPTGCFSLDSVFDCGGMPRGRILEVFGEESSGKSTLAMFIMAQIQKTGGKAVLIDAEYAFDADYASDIGVDVDKLIVSQPESMEEAFDVMNELIKTNEIDVIVIDSVAAMVPKSEIESDEILARTMAVQAQLLTKGLRILAGPISRSKTTVIFINQLRDNFNVMYGPKEHTPGGRALKFYASVRLNVRKGKKITDDGTDKGIQIGNRMLVKAVKNKVGFPWKEAEFELYYARGIDLIGDVVDYGEKIGVIHKVGNTWMFGEQKLGVGRDQAKEALTKDEELYKKIRSSIEQYVKDKK